MSTAFHDIDPTALAERLGTVPLEFVDVDGWDDIDGIDLEGTGEVEEFESVSWLSSLLYSDYAEADDDDDRATMNIPRSVLDSMAGEL